MKKKRKPSFSLKQMICGFSALLSAFFVVVLLNDAMGSTLPLPSAQKLSSWLNSLYQTSAVSANPIQADGEVLVHFIDVGQGDCTLIQTPEGNILIDAGDIGLGNRICDYLNAQDIETLDLVIATHPHTDHIGGMSDVIDRFQIGKIIFSDIPDSLIPTSKTYEHLLDSIADKNLSITKAKVGATYDFGDASLMILGPIVPNKTDLNNNSIICRLDYGETSFLFTGDAESESEDAVIQAFPNQLNADILKLGHHGSSSSTQNEWLKLVNPQIAVCSCGFDNSYGHPHSSTLNRLKKRGISLYRTDRQGTILISSDGTELSVFSEKAA